MSSRQGRVLMQLPLTAQGIAASCPSLQLLLLGGSTISAAPLGCSCQLECDRDLRDAAMAAVRSWTDSHADRCLPCRSILRM